MADELTSTANAPATPSTEQAQPASQPVPRPTQPDREQRTPEPTERAEKKPVNLQEFPEFKEYQRKFNQTLEQTRREAQQRIYQLEQQLEQIATRDMSTEELSEREKMKLRHQLEQQQAQYTNLYQQYARDLALNEVARRAGVDVNTVNKAESVDDAWEAALQARVAREREELEAKYKEKLASSPANQPDMGQQRPPVPVGAADGIQPFKSNQDLIETYRRLWDEANA